MNSLLLSLLVAVYLLAISDIAGGQAVPRCELSSPQAQSETGTRNEVPRHDKRRQERLRPQQRERFASRQQPREESIQQPTVDVVIDVEPDPQQFERQSPRLENQHPQLFQQPELQQRGSQPFEPLPSRQNSRQPQSFHQPRLPPQIPIRRPVQRQRPHQRRPQPQPQPQQPQLHQVGGGSENGALLSRYGYEELGNGKYALVVNGYGTWQQALTDCESQIPGATLFMATSPDDSAWLGQRINFEKDRVTGASKFWMGLTSRGPNGPLYWLDGSRYINYGEVVQVSGFDDNTKRFAWAVPDSFTRLKYEFLTADDEAESYICQYEIV